LLVAGEADIPYRSSKEIARDWLQDIGLVFKPMKHESTVCLFARSQTLANEKSLDHNVIGRSPGGKERQQGSRGIRGRRAHHGNIS
jgi:hypothetical protein